MWARNFCVISTRCSFAKALVVSLLSSLLINSAIVSSVIGTVKDANYEIPNDNPFLTINGFYLFDAVNRSVEKLSNQFIQQILAAFYY
jgi:hypothetical protein